MSCQGFGGLHAGLDFERCGGFGVSISYKGLRV